MDRVDILGIEFDNTEIESAVRRSVEMLSESQPHYVVTPNSEIVYACGKDERAKAAVNGADMVLPDGAGVVLASKILGTPLRQKVAGVDFALALCRALGRREKRLFLLGGKPGVAQRAGKKLSALCPGLIICGTADGYFQNDAEVIEKMNEAAPDVVFVCLGAPRQEIWMCAHLCEVNARLMAGLGGSLDVFAGEARRAPRLMIQLGLEWLYRLFRQPSRIGRMLCIPVFLMTALLHRVKGGQPDPSG